MSKKFSVLMSVYRNDDPEYLKVALDSVYCNQTRKPDEIVVVFDGPLTDGLYLVLESFKKGRESIVKYYPQEVNRGLGEALRIGSMACSGDYILRMDSDDISDSERFAKQIAYMEAHPDVDALGGNIAEFNEDPFTGKTRLRVCPCSHKDSVKMAKKRNPMNHVTACIKKSALLQSGGYQSLLLLEDYLLWLNMIVAGCKLANINETLVYVRVGNGFDSKRGAKERIVGWSKLQEIMLGLKLINRFQAWRNMVYIRLFVNTPAWLKRRIYSNFLRK